MKLSSMLPETHIIPHLHLSEPTKRGVIHALVNYLYSQKLIDEPEVSRQEVTEALFARENEQSTGIGDGFAFPHARLEKLAGFYMLFAIVPEGVAFDALDGAPCRYFVMSLVQRGQPNLLLKTRAAMTRFLMTPKVLPNIMWESREVIWQRIDTSGIMVDEQILAKDMMRAIPGALRPDMPLEEAARELHRLHVDALPMLDEHGVYQREFSCYHLFSYGIPKFFSSLHSVSYVKEMNPFEKYFMRDRSQTIGHLHSEESQPLISPAATIMEIIFEMTTHNRHQLYVVDAENKVLGVVDRYTIVDKILMSNV